MKLKSLDYKEVGIVRDETIEAIEGIYLNGRKAHRCEHFVDGRLPRMVHVKGLAKLTIALKGDIEYEIPLSLYPSIVVCADCLADYLLIDSVIGPSPGPDLAAARDERLGGADDE